MRLVIVSIISACVFGQQPIQNYPPGSAVYANDGAAGAGGLSSGDVWKDSGGNLHIKL